MAKRSNLWLGAALGSTLFLSAAMLLLMWRLGFLSFSGTDQSSKVVGAALALVGTWIGAVVSVVGILLKHSIDQQVERRQWEAEQRLKLEAATRAIQLFSTSAGVETPEIQRDGALFTLSNLGQHRLTLSLADDLWRKEKVDAGMVASLVDQAITRGDANEQIQAMDLLSNNASRLATEDGLALPACIENWEEALPTYVREWATITLGKAALARPAREWREKYPNKFPVIIASLAIAWQTEKNQPLKNDIGAILRGVLAAFPDLGTLYHPRMGIDAEQLRKEVANVSAARNAADEVSKLLDEWASVAGAPPKPRGPQV